MYIYIYIYIYIYMVRGTLNNSNFQIFKLQISVFSNFQTSIYPNFRTFNLRNGETQGALGLLTTPFL